MTVTLRQAEQLVGIPHVNGSFDCMHLAVHAQRELFGRNVGWSEARHPCGSRGQAAWIQRHRAALADPVEDPQTGDVGLYTETVDGSTHYHIATVFIERGERWLLHSRDGGTSILQREADAIRSLLRLEGYYRWRAVEDCPLCGGPAQ